MEERLTMLLKKPPLKTVTEPLVVHYHKKRFYGNDEELFVKMDTLPRECITNTSWLEYSTDCTAAFSLTAFDNEIIVKFYVADDFFKAVKREINGAVHLDNCVEFFVRFNNDDAYYNIEFNCLGIGKVAYGVHNKERIFLQHTSIKKIRTIIKPDRACDRFNWDMMLIIPLDVFEFSTVVVDEHLHCEANFYKCGDNLPLPHYLAWNRIEKDAPNFHSPEFFREIDFTAY